MTMKSMEMILCILHCFEHNGLKVVDEKAGSGFPSFRGNPLHPLLLFPRKGFLFAFLEQLRSSVCMFTTPCPSARKPKKIYYLWYYCNLLRQATCSLVISSCQLPKMRVQIAILLLALAAVASSRWVQGWRVVVNLHFEARTISCESM